MKGTSKVIMGATLVMLVSLAMVLGLILVLLAELYCSLLLRRRQLRLSSTSNTASAVPTAASIATESSSNSSLQPQEHSTTPPLSSLYSEGVLLAPRSFLFPTLSNIQDCIESKKQHSQISQLHQVIDIPTQESNRSLSPSISFPSSPQPIKKDALKVENVTSCSNIGENFNLVYISNPIYDDEACRDSRANTPFETPDTSPSRLEEIESSSEDDEISQSSPTSPITPPLTPMKKLPAEACSVSLKDVRSLGVSGTDSNSKDGLSSSSSGSPRTSPSW